MGLDYTLLLFFLLLALGVSFLCSLLEAALLSIPWPYVAQMEEQGRRAGRWLEEMKDDVDRPLAAILTLNTFAHTIGAAGVGAQAAKIWGDASVTLVSVVVTLLILIFSEIIPKTIGAVHARGLAGFVAFTIHWLIILLLPMVAVCNWTSRVFSHREQAVPRVSRDEISSLASIALTEGSIEKEESDVIRNLIALRETTVERVMTPRTVVFKLYADQTVDEVTSGEPPRFARIPVVEGSFDDVKGYVHRHAIYAARGEGKGDQTMAQLARPLHVVPEVASLPRVLREFLKRHEQLFLVVDEYGAGVGIVTLEDVLETLLGTEIVDETDEAVDMQKLAKRGRRRRGR